MVNTKRGNWGGSRAGAGRLRKAVAQRYGEVWVRLSMVSRVTVGTHTLSHSAFSAWWIVDGKQYTDYAAAAAEFVRRVNGSQ